MVNIYLMYRKRSQKEKLVMNHMEVSGAKGVRVARSLENVEQPHTDGTSKEMTAQLTEESSAKAIKAVESEVESRQNGHVDL